MSDERIDISDVGRIAADLMEQLERDCEAHRLPGEGLPSIHMVGIVVEVDWPGTDEEPGSTAIRYLTNSNVVWRNEAFFREAAEVVNRGREPASSE